MGLLNPTTKHNPNPGGSKGFKLLPGVRGAALYFGERDEYRVLLTRTWNRPHEPERIALFIGMNPSTAGHEMDDRTIRREMLDAYNAGSFNAYYKCNISPWRATKPTMLKKVKKPLSIPENLAIIRKYALVAEKVIVGFGRVPDCLIPLRNELLEMLNELEIPLFSYGINQDGSPPHPAYLPRSLPFVPWSNTLWTKSSSLSSAPPNQGKRLLRKPFPKNSQS